MPKKVYEINPFHGGINTKDDPRDILDHQLVDVLGASVDSKGVLKVIGNAEDLDITVDEAFRSDTNASGYGFFRFSADTDASGDSGTDANNTDYLLFWSEDNEKCYWYNSDDDEWTEAIDLATPWTAAGTDGLRKPIFSFANGALRIADSNFNNTTNETYWKGILDKILFKGTSNQRVDSGWYTELASVTRPSATTVKSAVIDDDDQTNSNDITWSIFSSRDSTDLVFPGNIDNDEWTFDDDSGEIQDYGTDRYGSGPYGTNRYQEFGFRSVDWDGSNDSAQTHGYRVRDTEVATQSDWPGFVIDPEKSLYVSLRLPSQDQLSAWGAGWTKNAATTVQYSNFSIELWSHEDPDNQIIWNIDSADIIKNGIDWFTVELAYGDAFENTLDGDYDIAWIKVKLDSNVVRSESHDYNGTQYWYAIEMADLRQGEPGLKGNDLLGIREVAYAFAYDENRTESILRSLGKVNFGNSISDFGHAIQFGSEDFNNKRVRGGALYVYDNDVPYMVAEADFVYGLRGSWESDWPGDDTSTDQWTQTFDQENGCSSNIVTSTTIPLIESYQARNGFSHKEDNTDARYKSLVITNNRAYAGNVFIDGKHYPDKMIKSQVFDYDVFPLEGRSIDVVQEDGDSITTMATYADRIFQFKRKKLYIINISETEFLEDAHIGYGVDQPQWVTEADKGIAWFNRNGAYFFDGKQINNLTDGLIDPDIWRGFVDDSGTKGQIFYLPLQSKIQIIAGAVFQGIPNYNYEFSLITGGWSRGKYRYVPGFNADATNPILDIDNDVKVLAPDTGKVYKWSDTPSRDIDIASTYYIETGDKVFDSSAIRKKIYRVHITHRKVGSSATMQVHGRADRGSWVLLGTLSDYNNFTVEEFDVSGMSNAKSFQLKITQTGLLDKDFEINDINIIYRSKNVR